MEKRSATLFYETLINKAKAGEMSNFALSRNLYNQFDRSGYYPS